MNINTMLESLIEDAMQFGSEAGNGEDHFLMMDMKAMLIERDRMLVEALKQIVSVWPTRDMMDAYSVAKKALEAIGDNL